MSHSKVYKLIIAGDGGIGKTTYVKTFCENKYIDQLMTIGVDLLTKKVKVNGIEEILQIWDLSGQDQFRFLLETFVRGCSAAILAFDCSRVASFSNLDNWLKLIHSLEPNAAIILIATKLDKGYHPALKPEMALEYVKAHNLIGFIETSSKASKNILIPFRRIVENLNRLGRGEGEIIFDGYVDEAPEMVGFPSPPAAPPKEEVKSTISTPPDGSSCPLCHAPLTPSQIKLHQAGRKVLCHKCLQVI
jgi:small GTP-binding protein